MQHIVTILTKAQIRAPRSHSANVHVFMARVRALVIKKHMVNFKPVRNELYRART